MQPTWLRRTPARVQIGSVSGDVRVALARGIGAALGLGTRSGAIRVDLPLDTGARRERHALRGTVGGGGASIRAGTVSGDLEVIPL